MLSCKEANLFPLTAKQTNMHSPAPHTTSQGEGIKAKEQAFHSLKHLSTSANWGHQRSSWRAHNFGGSKCIFFLKIFLLFVLFIRSFICLFMYWGCTHVIVHGWRPEDRLWEPLFSSHCAARSQGSSTGPQAWQQSPLPAEPSLPPAGGLKREKISLRLVALVHLVVPGFQENVEMERHQDFHAAPFEMIQVSSFLYFFLWLIHTGSGARDESPQTPLVLTPSVASRPRNLGFHLQPACYLLPRVGLGLPNAAKP